MRQTTVNLNFIMFIFQNLLCGVVDSIKGIKVLFYLDKEIMARNASRQLLLDQQLQKGESPSIGKRSGTPVNTGAGNKEKIECVYDFINFFVCFEM